MKLVKLLVLSSVITLTACSSLVVTYDAKGKVIGSCKATRGLLSTASASCTGSGNSDGVDYNKVDRSSGLLPVPPAASAILIQ